MAGSSELPTDHQTWVSGNICRASYNTEGLTQASVRTTGLASQTTHSPCSLPLQGVEYIRPTLIVVHAHGAIPLVVGHSSTIGTVHRYLEIVGPQAVAVSVRISKKATLR